MTMQKPLIVGLAVWCSLFKVCAGGEMTLIAWGFREGKPDIATYSVPVSEGHTNWRLVKVCPAGRFGGLVLGPDQVVRAVGDMPEFLKPPAELGKVIDIAAGGKLGMALREDKTLKIWGVDSRVKSLLSQVATNVAAIAAEERSYMVIDTAGTVHPFGMESLSAVENLGNVAAVSLAHGIFAQKRVALKRDGTVVEWRKFGGRHTPVPELSNVVAVAAGPVHGLALKRDGTVAAWGGQHIRPDGHSERVEQCRGDCCGRSVWGGGRSHWLQPCAKGGWNRGRMGKIV